MPCRSPTILVQLPMPLFLHFCCLDLATGAIAVCKKPQLVANAYGVVSVHAATSTAHQVSQCCTYMFQAALVSCIADRLQEPWARAHQRACVTDIVLSDFDGHTSSNSCLGASPWTLPAVSGQCCNLLLGCSRHRLSSVAVLVHGLLCPALGSKVPVVLVALVTPMNADYAIITDGLMALFLAAVQVFGDSPSSSWCSCAECSSAHSSEKLMVNLTQIRTRS